MVKHISHPAIKHLSPEKVEELYQKYLDPNEKVANLIEYYNIDIRPNLLSKVFPPYELNNQTCPYCEIAMYKKRKTKSGYYEDKAECYQCNHKVFSTQDSAYCNCKCTNCIEENRRKEITELNRTRALIRQKHALDTIRPVHYDSLSYLQKLILLTLFYTRTDEKLHCIYSLTDFYVAYPTKRLSPTDAMDMECINNLYSNQIIIADPESPIEAFDESTNYTEVDRNRANMLVNITFDGIKRVKLIDVYKKVENELSSHFHPDWADHIHDFLYEIATEEVMQYIGMKSKELNIPFRPKSKTREVVRKLLDNFSVSEIYYFVYKAVGDAHLFYAKGGAKSKMHAANTIPNKLASLGEKSKREGWSETRYSRDTRSPRSEISEVFFDRVLKDEDAGFHKAPGKQWAQELLPTYFSASMSSNYGVVRCPSCESISIVVSMLTIKQLTLKCLDCLKKATFILNKVYEREQ